MSQSRREPIRPAVDQEVPRPDQESGEGVPHLLEEVLRQTELAVSTTGTEGRPPASSSGVLARLIETARRLHAADAAEDEWFDALVECAIPAEFRTLVASEEDWLALARETRRLLCESEPVRVRLRSLRERLLELT